MELPVATSVTDWAFTRAGLTENIVAPIKAQTPKNPNLRKSIIYDVSERTKRF